MGVSPHVHFSWASTQGHHADDISAQADQAVRSVVHYELTHDTQDIDEERRALARPWNGSGVSNAGGRAPVAS